MSQDYVKIKKRFLLYLLSDACPHGKEHHKCRLQEVRFEYDDFHSMKNFLDGIGEDMVEVYLKAHNDCFGM
jgi:hypothetical protein